MEQVITDATEDYRDALCGLAEETVDVDEVFRLGELTGRSDETIEQNIKIARARYKSHQAEMSYAAACDESKELMDRRDGKLPDETAEEIRLKQLQISNLQREIEDLKRPHVAPPDFAQLRRKLNSRVSATHETAVHSRNYLTATADPKVAKEIADIQERLKEISTQSDVVTQNQVLALTEEREGPNGREKVRLDIGVLREKARRDRSRVDSLKNSSDPSERSRYTQEAVSLVAKSEARVKRFDEMRERLNELNEEQEQLERRLGELEEIQLNWKSFSLA